MSAVQHGRSYDKYSTSIESEARDTLWYHLQLNYLLLEALAQEFQDDCAYKQVP